MTELYLAGIATGIVMGFVIRWYFKEMGDA